MTKVLEPFAPHHRAFAQFWLRRLNLVPAPEPIHQLLALIPAAYERGFPAVDGPSAQEIWDQLWQETAPGEVPPAFPGLGALPEGLFEGPHPPLVRYPAGQNPADGPGCLALGKAFAREREIAGLLQNLLTNLPVWAPSGRIPQADPRLPGWERLNDGQKEAVSRALGGAFFLLTGGPGTGKTTTIFQILVQILTLAPGLRVALGAPTGRAAARIGESLVREAAGLPDGELKNRLTGAVPLTLHRLLGITGELRPARHHQDNPLPFDLVVVDESSMVDLVLVRTLLRALAPGAALVLAGDSDQLPSVEPGAVLQELGQVPGIQERTARLTVNQRVLGSGTGPSARILDQLFKTILHAGSSGVVNQLRQWVQPEIFTMNPLDSFWADYLPDLQKGSGAPRSLSSWVGQCQLSADKADEKIPLLLEKLQEKIILSPVRQGPWGVETLNQRLAALVQPPGTGTSIYPGLPWMITRNLPSLELNNGDRGLVVSIGGRLQAVFPLAQGKIRRLPFAMVSEDGEPSWAMTVHKSQGSEFQRVFMVVPESPGCDRKLLYTGVTRARSAVHLYAEESVLSAVAGRENRRVSLLSALMTQPVTEN